MWGDRLVWGDNLIGYIDATGTILYGDRLVWGDVTADRLVWGDLSTIMTASANAAQLCQAR